ncbi:hypothetical protein [Glutamicibacter sp.]|uniref:hypothetical protein n=1 Tax=Glutamicibacter sp. TaxID=1931995 RepID=UPI0028BDC245|nr:hypothetical protein [Glutamicibacter sp.]
MLAVAALVIAPVTAVAAPASAAAGSSLEQQGVNVVSPAGWGADFAAWMCRNYGVSCPG